VARAEAKAAAVLAEPNEPESAPEAPSAPEPQAESDPPKPSAWETIRQRAQEKQAARQQQEAKAGEQSQLERLQAEIAELRRGSGMMSPQQIADALRSNPAKALREIGVDPTTVLDPLTRELLTPGAIETQGTIQQLQAEIAELKRQIEQGTQGVREEYQSHIAQQQIAAERQAFVSFTGDPERYPTLAKFTPQERLAEGLDIWSQMQSAGLDYDRELVAQAAEERLQARLQRYQAVLAPPSEAQPHDTASAVSGQAQRRARPTTLTADLAAQSSGSPRVRTPKEKREASKAIIRRGFRK